MNVINDICQSLELMCIIVTQSYEDFGNHNWMLCLSVASPFVEYSVCVICLKHYHVQIGGEYGHMI